MGRLDLAARRIVNVEPLPQVLSDGKFPAHHWQKAAGDRNQSRGAAVLRVVEGSACTNSWNRSSSARMTSQSGIPAGHRNVFAALLVIAHVDVTRPAR